jgi:hypothetical protein
VLAFSGAIANSSVKGGAGGDTLTMELLDNSTATIIEGNAGDDTLAVSAAAAADIESTELRAGAGDDTITFSGGHGATVSADIFGGEGDDDINFGGATGLQINGGAGGDAIDWEASGVTYVVGFGDSNEDDFDTIGAGASVTGDTVVFSIDGEDIALVDDGTYTAVVGGDTAELVVSGDGASIFFGEHADINDITAAADYLDDFMTSDQAVSFTFASGIDGLSADDGDEFYLYVKGTDSDSDLLIELTDAGIESGGFVLTETNNFDDTEITFTV